MLVLTRRVGEEIVIAGEIRITVVSVRGDRVRIGIEAWPNWANRWPPRAPSLSKAMRNRAK
jgi:Global regulator protein family